MIEIQHLRRVHRTNVHEPAGRRARPWTVAAAIAIALLPALALAVVAPVVAAPAATVAPAAAPAPQPAARPPRAKNAPLVPISTPPPEFPAHARRARISGYVIATYTIGADGRVGNVRIVESSPKGVFDRVVETTLARWRYEPPSTPREITHTFDFDQ